MFGFLKKKKKLERGVMTKENHEEPSNDTKFIELDAVHSREELERLKAEIRRKVDEVKRRAQAATGKIERSRG